MGSADVSNPIAHGFVDSVFQSAGSGTDAAHLGSQKAHAEDVQFLTAHVFGSHVDNAFETEQGADGGGGNSMLASAGFGDDSLLAHALDQKTLPQAVVDFVRSGVEQVFALQIDFCATQFSGQAIGEKERGGPASVSLE